MSFKVKKLTPNVLKKMILEEARKLKLETLEQGKTKPEDVNARCVDANGFATTLEKKVDHMKTLKLKEAKLVKQLKKIREAKMQLNKYLLDIIDK
jgi:hypothetical protein